MSAPPTEVYVVHYCDVDEEDECSDVAACKAAADDLVVDLQSLGFVVSWVRRYVLAVEPQPLAPGEAPPGYAPGACDARVALDDWADPL